MKVQINPPKPLLKLSQCSLKLDLKKTKSINKNLIKKRHIIPVPVIVILLSSKSRNPTGRNINFFQDHRAINKIVNLKFPVVSKTNTILYLVSHEAI